MEFNVELAKEHLSYCPESGVFTWIKKLSSKSRVNVGDQAGSLMQNGYICIKFDGVRIGAHRLAWLFINECIKNEVVDHINGNPSDNRLCNLRDITQQGNVHNFRTIGSRNTSGYMGVCWDKQCAKWKAAITLDGKSRHIGNFSDPAVAHQAYLEVKRRLHPTCTI